MEKRQPFHVEIAELAAIRAVGAQFRCACARVFREFFQQLSGDQAKDANLTPYDPAQLDALKRRIEGFAGGTAVIGIPAGALIFMSTVMFSA